MAGSLAPVMNWAVCTTLCSALQSDAEQLPSGGDGTGQDALDGEAVEHFEHLGIHAKSLQSPEWERCCCALFTSFLVCLDHDSLLVT